MVFSFIDISRNAAFITGIGTINNVPETPPGVHDVFPMAVPESPIKVISNGVSAQEPLRKVFAPPGLRSLQHRPHV